MQLVPLAKNPIPSSPVVGALTAHDGLSLRFARWAATRGPSRGTICLFGGRGEFIEKYFEVIADLRRRGFAVATMDWRGQGGSERLVADPRRGHIDSFSDYDRDLRQFMKDVVLPDCPPPYIALAHSTGANILLRNVTVAGSWFDRMILTAPMIRIAHQRLGYPPQVVRAYAETGCLMGLSRSYVLGGTAEPIEMKPFEGNPLTSDHERWARNRAVIEVAPHLALGSATIGWLRGALRSCARISAPGYAESVQVPALIFAAGADTVVSARAADEFAARLKIGMQVLLPNARHEILQENDAIRQRFWAAFDAYLDVAAAA